MKKGMLLVLFVVFCALLFPMFASSAVLWDQPVATNTTGYYSQDYTDPANDHYDSAIADDFTNATAWQIDTIAVFGNFWTAYGLSLLNASELHWFIYTDDGGKPSGNPYGGGSSPTWSLSLAPNDVHVALTTRPTANSADVVLTVPTANPIDLPAGTWWLVFYPSIDYTSYGGWGRQLASTENGYVAQVIVPKGTGAWVAANSWTSVLTGGLPWLSPPTQQDFAFTLEGTPASPDITLSSPIAFGNQRINITSVPQSVTISNTGTSPLTLSGINITGANADQFAKAAGGTCGTTFPKVLAATASCTQDVTFTPTSVGTKTSSVEIASDDPDTPTATLALSGTGEPEYRRILCPCFRIRPR
jgi:hypothetical protein